LGGFCIVYQLMVMIADELDRACLIGHLEHRSCGVRIIKICGNMWASPCV
jgi:hypothetical protein